jgi:hypothetical protein
MSNNKDFLNHEKARAWYQASFHDAPQDQTEEPTTEHGQDDQIRDDIFVFLDDMKIAKRGKDGTPQADSWVVLKPGFGVVDSADLTKLSSSSTGKC